MMEYVGINSLRAKLAQKKKRVDLRYKFYEQKAIAKDFQISTPPQLFWVNAPLGWCGKAVDSLADRIVFRKFNNDRFDLTGIFQMNNPDILFDSAVVSALISSCCFAYLSKDEDGFPRIQIIDGGNATGVINPITGLLNEGYSVLDRNEYGEPTSEAYFTAEYTEYYKNSKLDSKEKNPTPYPLLVPVIYRPDDKRPFGHSRISRSCMSLMENAMRTIKRSEIGAEFYSYPQKYVTGLAQDAEIADKWKATMSTMMVFDKDDQGDHPIVGQFQAQSTAPLLEQLKEYASIFGGETGLTLDDLGFASGNPSSSDAIKAAHENLRLAGRKAQRCFGSGLLNIGMVAACLRDNYDYNRSTFYATTASWLPMFEADASSIGAIGDALYKINEAFPGYMTPDKIEELIGI